MKSCLIYFLLSILTCLSVISPLQAQNKEAAASIGCIDAKVRQQADLIKKHYISQGFVTSRDAMINMSSLEAFSVMVQLNKGQLYEIIYVGQASGTVHKMVLYDGNDKVIKDKEVNKQKGQFPDNYMIFEFVPDRTDTYLLMMMTKLKNKDFCGSLSVLTIDASKEPSKIQPYQP